MARVGIDSEIGALRRVICHTPGPELLAVTPATRKEFLYNDIIDLEQARREHHRFTSILGRFAEVVEVSAMLTEIVDLPNVRPFLIEKVTNIAHSEPVARRLLELKAEELVSLFIEGGVEEEGPLQRMLNVSNYALPPLPNLFFMRDASMVVGDRIVVGSMRHAVRWTEEILLKALFRYHPTLANRGLIYDGSEERRAGFTIEGGDMHVLRPDLVLLGLSQRSSAGAFDVIVERLIEEQGIQDVIAVVLPQDRAMIHLDMIFTMVDRAHCVVYPPSFIGPTRSAVLHFRSGQSGMREMPDLFSALREVDLPLAPILCGGSRRLLQEREQWTSGCNFFALRPGLVLGYSRNEATHAELEREAGYRVVDGVALLTGDEDIAEDENAVITFEGSELVRGGGGGRCMTLPVERESIW